MAIVFATSPGAGDPVGGILAVSPDTGDLACGVSPDAGDLACGVSLDTNDLASLPGGATANTNAEARLDLIVHHERLKQRALIDVTIVNAAVAEYISRGSSTTDGAATWRSRSAHHLRLLDI